MNMIKEYKTLGINTNQEIEKINTLDYIILVGLKDINCSISENLLILENSFKNKNIPVKIYDIEPIMIIFIRKV